MHITYGITYIFAAIYLNILFEITELFTDGWRKGLNLKARK